MKKKFALSEDVLRKEIEKQNLHRGIFMSTDYKVYYETVTVNGFSCLIVMEKKNLILPTFRKLMFVDCNKPFWKKLMYKAFVRAKCGCDKWHIMR